MSGPLFIYPSTFIPNQIHRNHRNRSSRIDKYCTIIILLTYSVCVAFIEEHISFNLHLHPTTFTFAASSLHTNHSRCVCVSVVCASIYCCGHGSMRIHSSIRSCRFESSIALTMHAHRECISIMPVPSPPKIMTPNEYWHAVAAHSICGLETY